MELKRVSVRCAIAGGGPAGMMLGLLLARAGLDVLVLEKHADFLRDFRGDTLHPSTLDVMDELGLLDALLRLPHERVHALGAHIGASLVELADFSHLPTRCPFIALMPQWDFLAFLAEQAGRYPTFHLRMEAQVTGLIQEGDRIVGLHATTPAGPLEVRADVTVGADGRRSAVRALAGLEVVDLGAPIDVLWLRISRRPVDPPRTLGCVDVGRILVMLNRGSYWQCAYVIRKDGHEEIQARGLPAFRETIAALAPYLRDRVDELATWDDVKLLTVVVDRLRCWHRPGLLCIGDAAHAMSPIGGVGINLAVQDAVAAANILAPALLRGAVGEAELHAVQARRTLPTELTQRIQVLIQDRVITKVLSGTGDTTTLAWPLRLLRRYPVLRRLPARLVGLGFRPEHVAAA